MQPVEVASFIWTALISAASPLTGTKIGNASGRTVSMFTITIVGAFALRILRDSSAKGDAVRFLFSQSRPRR